MKEYFVFPKTPIILTIRLFSVMTRTFVGGVLPLCRDSINVFCCPSRLGKRLHCSESLSESFLIIVARSVKTPSFRFLSILHHPFSLKCCFSVPKKISVFCIRQTKNNKTWFGFGVKQIIDSLSFLFLALSLSLSLSYSY